METEFAQTVRKYANGLVDFLRDNGSSFAAAKSFKDKLKKNGLHILKEENTWELKKNEGYILCRGNRYVFSFFIGKNFNFSNGSILISTGHLDSPCLKITPNNHLIRNKIYQLNVECYGRGLWNTWFDRVLGISGQVLFKRKDKVIEKIIQINKPLFAMPSLAIHLQSIAEYPIKVDYEKHLKPIAATTLVHDLAHTGKEAEKEKGKEKGKNEDKDKDKHKHGNDDIIGCTSDGSNISPILLHVLSKELQCKEEDIFDFELCLFDANEPLLCGVHEEFLSGGRLDNLAGTYAIFEAFIEHINKLKADTSNSKIHNNLIICVGYDNEEVGSETDLGAKSNLAKHFLDRILCSIFKEELKNGSVENIYGKLTSRSMILSIDMGHCSHPNYPDYAQPLHKIHFQEGIVIKYNANKNYATTPHSVALLKETWNLHEKQNNEKIKWQTFIVKNSMRCGSSVGPFVATNFAIPTVDIGIPQLAMHSIREIMSTFDLFYLIKGLQAFYNYYHEALKSFIYENDN